MCSESVGQYAVKRGKRICKVLTIWTTTKSECARGLGRQVRHVGPSALADRRKTCLPIPLAVQLMNQRMIAVDPVFINLAIAVTHAVHSFKAQRHIAVHPS